MNQLCHDRAASRRAPASPPVGPHLAGLAGLCWRLEARTAAEAAEHQTPESSLVPQPERALHFRQVAELIDRRELPGPSACDGENAIGGLEGVRQRLLAQHELSGLQRVDNDPFVQHGRGAHGDDIDIVALE